MLLMIKIFILSLSNITACLFCLGQSDIPELQQSGTSIEELIPKEWKLLSHETGDLNKDGTPDHAFVIQNTDISNFDTTAGFGEDTVDLNPRVLAIYFGSSTGLLNKVHQANKFIPLKDSPTLEEPFDGIKITEPGVLQIDFHFWSSMGSWSTSRHSYKFRYQNDHFELIHAGSSMVL